MSRLLVFAAAGEALTGLILLVAPSFIAQLLLGEDVTGSGVLVARVAGIALIGLAAACWPGPASLGMLTYSLLVTMYLGWLGATGAATGSLLWPAVLLHAALTAVLTFQAIRPPRPSVGKPYDN